MAIFRNQGGFLRPRRRGSEIQFTSLERTVYRRNFGFGVANGAMLMLGDTLIHPSLVLALFVSQISSSNLLVGLVPAISTGVWFLPQLFAAAFVQGRERQIPFAVASTIVRALAVATLGTIGFVVGDRNPTRSLSPSSSATPSITWGLDSPTCRWSMSQRASFPPTNAGFTSGSAASGAACWGSWPASSSSAF